MRINCSAPVPPFWRLVVLLMLTGIVGPVVQAQTFNSGSNGSDGPLELATPGITIFDPKSFTPPKDPDGDNVFHFTTINIAAGVTVKLSGQVLNGPMIWLATGTVTIAGTIDLNGEDGHPSTNVPAIRRPSVPGAGGYAGGVGGRRLLNFGAWPGSGPGGGVEGTIAFCCLEGGRRVFAPTNGGGGTFSGNQFVVPLVGGSGGGGGFLDGQQASDAGGGGAGGGGLLVASSTSISVNGSITANGGAGARGDGECGIEGPGAYGGSGSGGAIRLVAPIVSGTGALSARGGPRGHQCATMTGGGDGRIRLEAFQQNFSGSYNSTPLSLASPVSTFLSAVPASVRVVSVAGIPVNSSPTGSFEVPDVVLNQGGAVNVLVEARNVPIGTVVKVSILSENGPDQTIEATLTGSSAALSNATASVTFPTGHSRGFVRAAWTK